MRGTQREPSRLCLHRLPRPGAVRPVDVDGGFAAPELVAVDLAQRFRLQHLV